MSLLWPERLAVSLEPHRLAVGDRVIDVDPAYGSEPWHGVLEAFRREALAWRSLRVSVVLSNRFARFAVVPRWAEAASPEEELALARFHFLKVHGERAKSWEVRMASAGAETQLACAIDAGLLEGLKDCLPRLVSVQPYLICAFNAWRRYIPRHGAWLMLEESDRVCVARIGAHGWDSAAVHAGAGPDVIKRERIRSPGDASLSTVLKRPRADATLLDCRAAPLCERA